MTNAVNLASAAGTGFAFRNRIINGDMRIDQRNAGASVGTGSGSSGYSVDRWFHEYSQVSKFTLQQNAGAVSPPAGFRGYLGATSSSAYSVAAGDYFIVGQRIEGLNMSDLWWGTSSAATVTLSFWVRSSLTGTFGGAIRNRVGARSYPFTYSVASANTWEFKTITIAGDTSGSWDTDNSIGLHLSFGLGVGSTYSASGGSWQAGNFLSATGATSVVGTNGATLYITGVQLEVGSVATPFERRLYGQELALCQRYYARSGSIYVTNQTAATVAVTGQGSFPVTMRTSPTLSATSTSGLSVNEYRDIQFGLSIAAFSGYSTGTITGNAEL